jgi:TolA-binding protein
MDKKMFSVLAVILIVSAALLLISIKAQSQEEYETLVVPAKFFANIENKIERVSSQIDKLSSISAIQQKLDQIMANQEDIKARLDILKTRIR